MATIEHRDINDDFRVIVISERMDFAGTELIERPFASLVGSAKKDVVVDISDVTFLSSVGIRMFIANGKALMAAGGRMALLVGVNASAIRTLKMTCVDAILPLFEKFEEAEAALKA